MLRNLNYRERVKAHYLTNRRNGYKAENALQMAKFSARYSVGKAPFHHAWGYAGEEETALPNGWTLIFKIEHDDDRRAPEDEFDGHGVTHETTGQLTEAQRKWCLYSGWRKSVLYDYAASLEKAKREGWGPGSAENAVKRDFEYLRGYYQNDWCYVGLGVELQDQNGNELGVDWIWGMETSDAHYLAATARDMAAWLLVDTRKKQRAADRTARINSRFQDAMCNAL